MHAALIDKLFMEILPLGSFEFLGVPWVSLLGSLGVIGVPCDYLFLGAPSGSLLKLILGNESAALVFFSIFSKEFFRFVAF